MANFSINSLTTILQVQKYKIIIWLMAIVYYLLYSALQVFSYQHKVPRTYVKCLGKISKLLQFYARKEPKIHDAVQ